MTRCGSILRSLALGGAVCAVLAASGALAAQARVRGRHHARVSLEVRVGRLLKDGKCGDAVDLALSSGNLDLAAKARGLCAPASPTAVLSQADGPAPPKSLTEQDVQSWAARNVDPKGWSPVDYDQEGVHLVDAAGARTSPDNMLMISGREELFRPAERSGVLARSDRQEFEVDCRARRFRLLSIEVFADNNLTGKSRTISGPLTGWLDAEPGSHRAVQVEQLCGAGLKTAAAPDPAPILDAAVRPLAARN